MGNGGRPSGFGGLIVIVRHYQSWADGLLPGGGRGPVGGGGGQKVGSLVSQ